MNLVHGSDSLASAEREVALFFEADELFDYEMTIGTWT
jgi:nucleoside-diphosphate kinase